MSKKSNRFSPEVRERAVRMVQEHRGEYSSLWAAIESISPKIGCVSQTLHEWVRKQEIDTGLRDGVNSEERPCPWNPHPITEIMSWLAWADWQASAARTAPG
jgi:transposase-like protein